MERTNRRKKKKIGRYVSLCMVLAVSFVFFFGGLHESPLVVIPDIPVPAVKKVSFHEITPGFIEDNGLTIDPDLQAYIADLAGRYRVGFVAVTVMDAKTGDILALYGKDSQGQNCSLALDTYLAASTFKFVTAAAALNTGDITPQRRFIYNGKAHTLYRDQIFGQKNRWSREVSLQHAFAKSNNIVFGKMGTKYIGEAPLLLTAMKMGFWRSPLQGTDCSPSTVFIPETPYNIAELASGFNRHTRISPVHAASMVTCVLNDGCMIEPHIFRDSEGPSVRVMSPDTAAALGSMMHATILSGTASKTFRGFSRDRVLRHLYLGAKTGSLNGHDPEGRRNWFISYAEDQQKERAITVGCLVIRGDSFWIEADGFSKKIIRHYFSESMEVASRH